MKNGGNYANTRILQLGRVPYGEAALILFTLTSHGSFMAEAIHDKQLKVTYVYTYIGLHTFVHNWQ